MAVIDLTNVAVLGKAPINPQIPYYPIHWQAITASDTDSYNPPLAGVYVGVTGDVALEAASNPGTFVVFKAVPAGASPPASGILRVRATNTTAANLVGVV